MMVNYTTSKIKQKTKPFTEFLHIFNPQKEINPVAASFLHEYKSSWIRHLERLKVFSLI